jgi:mRNA interferase MazF
LRDAPLLRVPLEPDAENGLQTLSHLMIDKAITLPRTKIGQRIGHVDPATMRSVNRALAIFFGLTRSIAE